MEIDFNGDHDQLILELNMIKQTRVEALQAVEAAQQGIDHGPKEHKAGFEQALADAQAALAQCDRIIAEFISVIETWERLDEQTDGRFRNRIKNEA